MFKTMLHIGWGRSHRMADGPGAIGLLEESAALIRRAPMELLGIYYLGTAPFVLGFLYFWAEMSRGAYARSYLVGYALLLSVLFCFMKTAQALFAARVRRMVRRELEPPWSWRRVGQVLVTQVILQPVGLIILPLAGLAVLPFCYVYAYYTLLGGLSEDAGLDVAGLRRRAWEQAGVRPLQNGLLVWLTCPWIMAVLFLVAFLLAHGILRLAPAGEAPPFAPIVVGLLILFFMWPLNPLGMALAVNLAVAILAGPFLLLKLAGLETIFTVSQAYAALNTSFLAVVFGLVYLAVDPLAKAAFALKAFYTESLRTGADLRARIADLREARRSSGAGGRLFAFVVWGVVGAGVVRGASWDVRMESCPCPPAQWIGAHGAVQGTTRGGGGGASGSVAAFAHGQDHPTRSFAPRGGVDPG